MKYDPFARRLCLLLFLIFSSSPIQAATYWKSTPSTPPLSSITIKDRSGMNETINNPERLKQFEQINFFSSQPYQQVLRVYKRDSNGVVRSYLTQYHENGHPEQHVEIVDNRALGNYWEWHANGSLKVSAHVLGGLADLNDRAKATWIFDGMNYVWDDCGNILAQIPYCNGELQGHSYYYHPNGQIWKILPFDKNQLNGCVEIFCDTGELLERGFYVKGIKQGPTVRYWNSQQQASEECFQEGLLIKGSYFNRKGDLIAVIEEGEGQRAIFDSEQVAELQTYKHGIPEGEILCFDKFGKVGLRYHIKNGVKHGEETYYFELPGKGHTTQPRLFINWFEGKIQGWVRTWYPDGTQESQREMTNNMKNGILTAWYADGNLMLIEEYDQDRLIKGEYYRKGERYAVSFIRDGAGVATMHDREGNFIKRVNYAESKPQLD